jgi:hypothetical protein
MTFKKWIAYDVLPHGYVVRSVFYATTRKIALVIARNKVRAGECGKIADVALRSRAPAYLQEPAEAWEAQRKGAVA